MVETKKGVHVRFKRMESDRTFEEYKERMKELKQAIRRSCKMALANRMKENPKAFYSYK